ncbi:hypothetical protein RB195_015772 [Necator americanus]|uniref:Uncharacterized protein n=1 Tax=Necator americanus TaxID=51031 RepID=A0ABR1E676_NECAM
MTWQRALQLKALTMDMMQSHACATTCGRSQHQRNTMVFRANKINLTYIQSETRKNCAIKLADDFGNRRLRSVMYSTHDPIFANDTGKVATHDVRRSAR